MGSCPIQKTTRRSAGQWSTTVWLLPLVISSSCRVAIPHSVNIGSGTRTEQAVPTSIRAEKPAPHVQLRWDPPLVDAMSDSLVLVSRVKLLACFEGGECSSIEEWAPPCGVFDTKTSPKDAIAFVWFRCGDAPHKLRIIETTSGRQLGETDLGDGADLPIISTDLRWAAGSNVLHTWGAGANAAEARLYDRHARLLLSIAADGIEVSPSVRYVAAFPAPSTLEPSDVRIFDLSDGSEIAHSPSGVEITEARDVRWRSKSVSISYSTVDRAHGEFVFPLPNAP